MGYHQQSCSTLMLLGSPNTSWASISTLHLHSLPQTTSKYMKRKPPKPLPRRRDFRDNRAHSTPVLQKAAARPHPTVWELTLILRSEFTHFCWESLIELVLPLDKGLTDRLVIKPEDTGVSPDLVDKGLEQDSLGIVLHFHSSKCWAHPCSTLDRGRRQLILALQVRTMMSVFLSERIFAVTNSCISIMRSCYYRMYLIIIMKMDIFQVNLEYCFSIRKAFCTVLLT